MRYRNGIVAISPDRDIPLLVQVRNSKFISHEQLFGLMETQGLEHSRNSFNWRVKRLLGSGFILACPGNFGCASSVYRIGSDGLIQLENHGHFVMALNSSTRHLPHPSQIPHALELNAVHLALLRAGLLIRWQSELETTSWNTVSRSPLEKDFDAIVDAWNGNQMARFGLEYERTVKNSRAYERIRTALGENGETGCVLYLTSGFDVALHLAHELSGTARRLAFTTANAFQSRLLDTPVMTFPECPQVPFRELLRGIF